MDLLPDMYAAPEAKDRRGSEIEPSGPLEFAAILFAVGSVSFAALGCLRHLDDALGGIAGLGGSDDAWQPFVVNLLGTTLC